MQAIFRNPGFTLYSGTFVGAAFALRWLFQYHLPKYEVFAFGFGLIAVAMSYLAAIRQNGLSVSLILSGVIVGGIFTALLTIVQFMSDPLNCKQCSGTMGICTIQTGHQLNLFLFRLFCQY